MACAPGTTYYLEAKGTTPQTANATTLSVCIATKILDRLHRDFTEEYVASAATGRTVISTAVQMNPTFYLRKQPKLANFQGEDNNGGDIYRLNKYLRSSGSDDQYYRSAVHAVLSGVYNPSINDSNYITEKGGDFVYNRTFPGNTVSSREYWELKGDPIRESDGIFNLSVSSVVFPAIHIDYYLYDPDLGPLKLKCRLEKNTNGTFVSTGQISTNEYEFNNDDNMDTPIDLTFNGKFELTPLGGSPNLQYRFVLYVVDESRARGIKRGEISQTGAGNTSNDKIAYSLIFNNADNFKGIYGLNKLNKVLEQKIAEKVRSMSGSTSGSKLLSEAQHYDARQGIKTTLEEIARRENEIYREKFLYIILMLVGIFLVSTQLVQKYFSLGGGGGGGGGSGFGFGSSNLFTGFGLGTRSGLFSRFGGLGLGSSGRSRITSMFSSNPYSLSKR